MTDKTELELAVEHFESPMHANTDITMLEFEQDMEADMTDLETFKHVGVLLKHAKLYAEIEPMLRELKDSSGHYTNMIKAITKIATMIGDE